MHYQIENPIFDEENQDSQADYFSLNDYFETVSVDLDFGNEILELSTTGKDYRNE